VLAVAWLADGSPTPVAPETWSLPLADGGPQGLYLTYSLIVATFLGTMGLPHVVVRFYTNPDGRAARRTTLVVLALLGAFYLLPAAYGALGRVHAADLERPDSLVLELPRLMVDGALGHVLTGLVVAGAFAAFLSTSSGLAIALAGVLSQDLVDRIHGSRVSGVTAFRMAAVAAVALPCLGAVALPNVGIARSVGLAFAVAASTFAPLLLLGIWWRRLTDVGAIAGLAVGFVGSTSAVLTAMTGWSPPGWWGVLLTQPAAWSVPLAFAAMVAGSLLTPTRVSPMVNRLIVRLHTPESVEVQR